MTTETATDLSDIAAALHEMLDGFLQTGVLSADDAVCAPPKSLTPGPTRE